EVALRGRRRVHDRAEGAWVGDAPDAEEGARQPRAAGSVVRRVAVLATLALVGCPKAAPVVLAPDVGDQWVGDSPVAPKLCIASLPQAGPLLDADRALFIDAVARIRAGEGSSAWDALRGAMGHPAFDAARAVLSLVLGDAEAAHIQQTVLVGRFPD